MNKSEPRRPEQAETSGTRSLADSHSDYCFINHSVYRPTVGKFKNPKLNLSQNTRITWWSKKWANYHIITVYCSVCDPSSSKTSRLSLIMSCVWWTETKQAHMDISEPEKQWHVRSQKSQICHNNCDSADVTNQPVEQNFSRIPVTPHQTLPPGLLLYAPHTRRVRRWVTAYNQLYRIICCVSLHSNSCFEGLCPTCVDTRRQRASACPAQLCGDKASRVRKKKKRAHSSSPKTQQRVTQPQWQHVFRHRDNHVYCWWRRWCRWAAVRHISARACDSGLTMQNVQFRRERGGGKKKKTLLFQFWDVAVHVLDTGCLQWVDETRSVNLTDCCDSIKLLTVFCCTQAGDTRCTLQDIPGLRVNSCITIIIVLNSTRLAWSDNKVPIWSSMRPMATLCGWCRNRSTNKAS